MKCKGLQSHQAGIASIPVLTCCGGFVSGVSKLPDCQQFRLGRLNCLKNVYFDDPCGHESRSDYMAPFG